MNQCMQLDIIDFSCLKVDYKFDTFFFAPLDDSSWYYQDEIYECKLCRICIAGASVQFVGIKLGMRTMFFHTDYRALRYLLETIYKNPDAVAKELYAAYKEHDFMFYLWKHLLRKMCVVLKVSEDDYLESCGFTYSNERNIYSAYFYTSLSSADMIDAEGYEDEQLFREFDALTPEKREMTRQTVLRRKAESFLSIISSKFTSLMGSGLIFAKSGNDLLERYKEVISSSCSCRSDWEDMLDNLYNLRDRLVEYWNSSCDAPLTLSILSASYSTYMIIPELIAYVTEQLIPIEKTYLCNRFGTISEIRKQVRQWLGSTDFKAILQAKREFEVHANDCSDEMTVEVEPVTEYKDVFDYSLAVLGDRLNFLSRDKSKNKEIDETLLRKAKAFFFSPDPNHGIAEKDAENIEEAGLEGEAEVEKTLAWLDSNKYIRIARQSDSAYRSGCILIKNPSYINVAQEFDHLIVCPAGVIAIETKNFSGNITIDSSGNWIREKNGVKEGLTNPVQQVRRHELLLKSFLPDNVRVISFICIANNRTTVSGTENCTVAVVKSDLLLDRILNLSCSDSLPDEQMHFVEKEIYDHVCNRKK